MDRHDVGMSNPIFAEPVRSVVGIVVVVFEEVGDVEIGSHHSPSCTEGEIKGEVRETIVYIMIDNAAAVQANPQ